MPNQNFRVKNGLEVGTGATISSGGNITAGIITATSFVGSGSQLTGIVASGTVNYANISGVSSSVVGGAVSATSLTVTGVSTFEGAISVRNGYNLNIGDNNDLRIYNDGTHSRIEETGSGSLYISGSDINIQQDSTNKNFARFIGGGAVELYYNDSKKFETLGAGATVTGTTFTNQLSVSGVSTLSGTVNFGGGTEIISSGEVKLAKLSRIMFGSSGGTPNGLILRQTDSLGSEITNASNLGSDDRNITIQSSYNGDVIIKGQYSNRAVFSGYGLTVTGTTFTNQLSVSGVSTFQNNVYLGDSDVLNLGDSNDLQISHNPGVTPYNFINGGTTSLTIRSGDLDIQSGSQNYTSFLANNTNTIISWSGTNSDSKRVKVDQTSVELYADVKVLPISSYPAKFNVGTGGTIITTTSGGLVGIGSTNPTSKLQVSGAITGTSVNDSIGNVRAVPQNAKTSAYILAASDVGKHIGITTGGVTVDAGIFSAGDAVSIYNNSSSNQTITQGTSVTMYLAGTATTGNRTLAQRGVATVLCVGTDTFVIMGGGLT